MCVLYSNCTQMFWYSFDIYVHRLVHINVDTCTGCGKIYENYRKDFIIIKVKERVVLYE